MATTLAERATRTGLPPAWLGYRYLEVLSPGGYARLREEKGHPVHVVRRHEPATASNPLPVGVVNAKDLPDDRGWWGFSFRDVPNRRSGETTLLTLPQAKTVTLTDDKGEFWSSVLTEEDWSLDLREMQIRPWHRERLRKAPKRRVESGIWFAERVFHNYSHWLTAHLPKLIMLRENGLSSNLMLPKQRPYFVDASLQSLGFEYSQVIEFEPGEVLLFDELTIVVSDRFRPELLNGLRRSVSSADPPQPQTQRLFISREGSQRRRLLNENAVWPILEAAGFERIKTEDFSFDEQVSLMQQAEAVCGPHGAGLSNIIFCSPGTKVIEIADRSFPNPNVYATAAAQGLPYCIVPARGMGDCHPLEQDLEVDPTEMSKAIAAQGLANGR